MTKTMFSVKDNKSGLFFNPQVNVHRANVIRGLQQELKNPESVISQYPEDYTLYELGQFNDETGEVISKTSPEMVINCVDLKEVK